MATVRPTLSHARAAHYRRPGGPWDRGPLDSSFPSGGRATVVDDAGRLDAAGLESAVAAVSGALAAAGVRRRTVVAWQLHNSAVGVVLYRACWRLGAVAAPLHHRLGPAEVAAALDQVDPAMVLATGDLPASGRPGATVLAPGLAIDALLGAMAPGSPLSRGAMAVRPSDVAVALFTSGSTGTPKAVLHTHRGLGYKAATMVAVHGLGADDAVLMPAPLAHVSGLLNGVLLPATAAIPAVLMASWDPEQALRRMADEQVTYMGAPPVFFSQMAQSPSFGPAAARSMRLVSTGGASVSPAFVESTAAAFGCRVKRTYGSTEVPTVTTSGPSDSAERARDYDGRVVGEAEVAVHDPDSGERLGAGHSGELWVRGPEVFVGYADAGATDMVVSRPGRWYRTGDLGVFDEGGWLRVVGRLSDIIIRAGENISASEVEAVLEAHPQVRQAVAVAVPDGQVGERVAAYVEAGAGFDLSECRRWFESRGMTRFKTPEYVVRVDAIPVLATGKADRAALRARAAALASEDR